MSDVERMAEAMALYYRERLSSIKPEDNPNYSPYWLGMARVAIAAMGPPLPGLGQ